MLGDLQVFGDLIYKLGNVNKSNNAAELFQKTTEKFSDWSRTEYSHEIGNLVEFRREHDFTADQPELPLAKLRNCVARIVSTRSSTKRPTATF